jgi:stringent starvation protein B
MAMLRSYLVDTTYEWILDHGFTPYFLVDTEYESVEVPWDYVEDDGKIVLNLSAEAIVQYECTDEHVAFEATFDGEVTKVFLPMESIIGVYAKETSQGIYAREHGYGMMVNEGENDDVNPDSLLKDGGLNNSGQGLRLV